MQPCSRSALLPNHFDGQTNLGYRGLRDGFYRKILPCVVLDATEKDQSYGFPFLVDDVQNILLT